MQIRAHIQLPSLRRLRGLVQLLGLVKNDLLEVGEFLGIEEASLMLALHKKACIVLETSLHTCARQLCAHLETRELGLGLVGDERHVSVRC